MSRSELDRLRKVKRLQELETRAASSPQNLQQKFEAERPAIETTPGIMGAPVGQAVEAAAQAQPLRPEPFIEPQARAMMGGAGQAATLGYATPFKQEQKAYPGHAMTGNVAGSAAAMAPFAKLAQGATIASTAARGAGLGGLLGGATKPLEGESRASNAASGAALGAAAPLAAKGLTKGVELAGKGTGWLARYLSGFRAPEAKTYLENKKFVETMIGARGKAKEHLVHKWAKRGFEKAHGTLDDVVSRAEDEIQLLAKGQAVDLSPSTQDLLKQSGVKGRGLLKQVRSITPGGPAPKPSISDTIGGRPAATTPPRTTKLVTSSPGKIRTDISGKRNLRADDAIVIKRDLDDALNYSNRFGGSTATGDKTKKAASNALRKEIKVQYPKIAKQLDRQSENLSLLESMKKYKESPFAALSRDSIDEVARLQGLDKGVSQAKILRSMQDEAVDSLRTISSAAKAAKQGDLEKFSRLATVIERSTPRGGDVISGLSGVLRQGGRRALPITEKAYSLGEKAAKVGTLSPLAGLGVSKVVRERKRSNQK